jgi:hypothetical protein
VLRSAPTTKAFKGEERCDAPLLSLCHFGVRAGHLIHFPRDTHLQLRLGTGRHFWQYRLTPIPTPTCIGPIVGIGRYMLYRPIYRRYCIDRYDRYTIRSCDLHSPTCKHLTEMHGLKPLVRCHPSDPLIVRDTQ